MSKEMKIALIGSGRVATHLALKLKQQHQVLQIYSRNKVHAEKLASRIQAQAVDELQALDPALDLVVLCVSDQAIAELAQQLSQIQLNALVVHTSGSTALEVLATHLSRIGVFYPLQTFSMDCAVDWSNTPLLIEAHQVKDQQLLTDLAQQISHRVYVYSSAQRLSLHLAAVFACNFSNYCYDMAQQIVQQQQVDFALLQPLILATAAKVMQIDAKDAQTGPALRGDQPILDMHQDLLKQQGLYDFAEIYALMSQAIMHRAVKV